MKKIYVSDLQKYDGIFEDYFILHTLRNNVGRKGEYIELVISDKTGELKAFLFNLDVVIEEGVYKIKGEAGSFNEERRVIIKEAEKVEDYDSIKMELLPSSEIPKEMLKRKILEEINNIKNEFLKKLLLRIFDEKFIESFVEAPAAFKYHHAYLGGLAEHTLNVLKLVKTISGCYKELNTDLLIAGAILHDIGKVLTYKIGFKLKMTDEGKLLDHIYLGMKKVDEEIEKLNRELSSNELFPTKFPEDLRLNLLHLLASHHGSKKKGSLTEPMTKEAYILHIADLLDAEIYKFEEAIKMSQEGDRWTPFHNKLKKSIFLGGKKEND
ncbi:MAG: HD domain-containing protein [Candidatus Hydrothermales bacterium]